MNKLEDLQWITDQIDDLAVLLRVHGVEDLADQFEAATKLIHSRFIGPAAGMKMSSNL